MNFLGLEIKKIFFYLFIDNLFYPSVAVSLTLFFYVRIRVSQSSTVYSPPVCMQCTLACVRPDLPPNCVGKPGRLSAV